MDSAGNLTADGVGTFNTLNVSGTEIDTNGNTSIDGTLAVSGTTTFGTVGSPATVTIHKVPTAGTDGVNKTYVDALIRPPTAYIGLTKRTSDGTTYIHAQHDIWETTAETENPYELILVGVQVSRDGVYHVVSSYSAWGGSGYDYYLRVVTWRDGAFSIRGQVYMGERRESTTVSTMLELEANDKIFIVCDAASAAPYVNLSVHSC
jgi:hypothetical protein